MWEIVFPRKLFDDLRTFLFSSSPNENGCFLLGRSYEKEKSKVLIISKVLYSSKTSWNYFSGDSLEPTSSYINQAVVRADSANESLIFIHTHPSSFHPVTFSAIDESSNKRLFANLSQILPDVPLFSLVLSQHEIFGVVYERGRTQTINRVRISGKILYDYKVAKNKTVHSRKIIPMFDRQVRMFGEDNQKKLQNLSIAIVGAGGTGSSVAVQLARIGVKKLIIIDFDTVDESNLSRVYGATTGDVGKFKVDVVKDHIQTFSRTSVEAIPRDITKTNLLKYLLDSDVILSCTDNLTSRSILNDIAIQYFIPLIDVGCRIHLEKDGSINQAVVKVQAVTPDDACLWCTGTLDGRLILQESFSQEERRKLEAEGYCQGVEKQPSIISLTTMAASLAVQKILEILGVFGDNYDTTTQIELKNGFMIGNSPEIKSGCICLKRRGIASERKIIG